MERYASCCTSRTPWRAARARRSVLFATRLTRITMELRRPDAASAMAAASRAVSDWSGGTRIGDAAGVSTSAGGAARTAARS